MTATTHFSSLVFPSSLLRSRTTTPLTPSLRPVDAAPPAMTAAVYPARRGGSSRALLPIAAAAAAVAVVVAATATAAAAQRVAAVTGLSRSRGVLVDAVAGGVLNSRIVGGRDVTADDAVYGGGFFTKLLFQSPQGLVFYCAGALVSPNKVLTAAHCYDGGDPALAVGDIVRIGGLDLTSGLERTIAAVAVHPAYQIAVVGNFDIAIVTIADPPSPTEYGAAGVAPAFINAFSRFPRPGTTLYVAGHGLTSGVPSPDAALSPTLRLTAVPINTWSQCNSWWRKRLPPSLAAQQIVPAASQPLQVCGGLGTADSTCLGDSGGALFERRSLGGRDFFRVFGVVSYGVSLEDDLCPVIHPTYFAATSAANAFISANM